MKVKELTTLEGIEYSIVNGGYHKTFHHNDKTYRASLLPFAMNGSACTIIKIDNEDDVNNVTASDDTRKVFYKRFSTFKKENLMEAIKEFIIDYAL